MQDRQTQSRQERRSAERAAAKTTQAKVALLKQENRKGGRQHTAIREAGHAVVAYSFGVRINTIRIASRGRPIRVTTDHGPAEFAAHTDYDWEGYGDRRSGMISAIISLGGIVANGLWPSTSTEYDHISAKDDLKTIESMFDPGLPNEERQQAFEEATQAATDILSRHHEAVWPIVAELMRRDEMSGDEVWAICDPVFARLYEPGPIGLDERKAADMGVAHLPDGSRILRMRDGAANAGE